MNASTPVALVTGATDGIGLATAVALAGRGHRLLVHGRDPARARRAVDAVRAAGGEGAVAARR